MWYVWIIGSLVVGFVTMVLGSRDDFMFDGSDLWYGVFVVVMLSCVGGVFHGIMKIFGW